MIIKSMARKSASFSQLARYMNKGKESHKSFEVFYKNLYSTDSEGISKEFEINAEILNGRKNGNYLYHEVFSITRNPNLTFDEQKEKLYQFVNDYVELRAKRNLVYGVLHTDNPSNLHFHLMISSNELGSEKRHRLSKEVFAKIQKEIEKNILNSFPELEQKIIYNQNKDEKTKKEEYELKKRTGKESKRDKVKTDLENVFETAKNKVDFFNKLTDKGFEIYIRGNTIGVKHHETGRNYRLKTLGLLDKFNAISKIIESSEEKINSNTVNKEFSKERIDTSSYNKQQEKPSEPIPERPEEKNSTKDFSKEKINTGFKQEEKSQENPKPAEEIKPKEKPSNHYTEKMNSQNNDESEKKQDRRSSRSDDRTKKQQENKSHHHKRDENRYQRKEEAYKPKPKNEREAYKPKSENDLKRAKQDDKSKYQEHSKKDERVKTDRTQKTERKQDEKKRDYNRNFQQEKTKVPEPKSEVELEIERRKQQMKKERENEADYSNDYSKGR